MPQVQLAQAAHTRGESLGSMDDAAVCGHITAAMEGFIQSIALGQGHSVANVLQDTLRY